MGQQTMACKLEIRQRQQLLTVCAFSQSKLEYPVRGHKWTVSVLQPCLLSRHCQKQQSLALIHL